MRLDLKGLDRTGGAVIAGIMGYRILVLGDHKDHADALKQAAERAGHEVLVLSTVKQSMEWLNTKDHTDVIVCHAFLQNDSMFDFLRAVKRDERHNWIQFIVVSCESTELSQFLNASTQDASRLLGADKYVMMKEFNVNRLLKEIEASFPEMPPQKDQDPKGDALGISRPASDVPKDVNEAQKGGI